MTVNELLGFLCAALAACGNAVANVMQRKASLEESPDQPFGFAVMRRLLANGTWILGFLGMVTFVRAAGGRPRAR